MKTNKQPSAENKIERYPAGTIKVEERTVEEIVEGLTECKECKGTGRAKCPVKECPDGSHPCIGCRGEGSIYISPEQLAELLKAERQKREEMVEAERESVLKNLEDKSLIWAGTRVVLIETIRKTLTQPNK